MPSTRSRNTRNSNPTAEVATTPRRGSRTSSRRVRSSPAQPRDDPDDTEVNDADSGSLEEEGANSEELDDTVPHTQGTVNNDDEGAAHQEPGIMSEDDKQFFLMCLPDLQKTTDELMEKLRSEPQSAVQQRILEFKKRAFSNAREQYILNASTPNTSIFIDTASFEGLDAEADGLMTALARANLVSTLDATRQDGDLLPVLEHLDNTFLDVFSPLGIGALNLDLALELRTQCFVTAFAQNDSKDWFENGEWVLLLATMFCKGVEGVSEVIEAEPFLADGPFRELCGYVDDTVVELVVTRVERIKQLLLECEDEAEGRKRLGEEYLLDRFLESLESWAVEEFETSSPEPIFRYRPSLQSQGTPAGRPRDLDALPASSPQVTQDAGPSVPEGYNHAALLLTPQVESPRVRRTAPGGGGEEDEDMDALIEDLESDDGHDIQEEEDENQNPGGGRTVPEDMLQTDSRVGLTESEVTARRRKFGLNQMKEEKENLILKFLGFFVGPIQFVMEVSNPFDTIYTFSHPSTTFPLAIELGPFFPRQTLSVLFIMTILFEFVLGKATLQGRCQ